MNSYIQRTAKIMILMQDKKFADAIVLLEEKYIENKDLESEIQLLLAITCDLIVYFTPDVLIWRDRYNDTRRRVTELINEGNFNKTDALLCWWMYHTLVYKFREYYPEHKSILSNDAQMDIIEDIINTLFKGQSNNNFYESLINYLEEYRPMLVPTRKNKENVLDS